MPLNKKGLLQLIYLGKILKKRGNYQLFFDILPEKTSFTSEHNFELKKLKDSFFKKNKITPTKTVKI
jgi:hypothetical protein